MGISQPIEKRVREYRRDYKADEKSGYIRTYAALLAKIGPTRMNEIKREAESTVRELLGGNAA